jgi:hypothetical protein
MGQDEHAEQRHHSGSPQRERHPLVFPMVIVVLRPAMRTAGKDCLLARMRADVDPATLWL